MTRKEIINRNEVCGYDRTERPTAATIKTVSPVELRAWQKARGLSSANMCDMLQVAPCTYSRWLNGRQKTPRWLAGVLSTSPWWAFKTTNPA